jgi:hypothetical protein
VAGILTLLPVASAFPKISVTSLLASYNTTYSCGTVGDFHPGSYAEPFSVPILIGRRTTISLAKVTRKNKTPKFFPLKTPFILIKTKKRRVLSTLTDFMLIFAEIIFNY